MTEGHDDRLHLARMGKPHGIRGEVTVQVFTDNPDERFRKGEVVNSDHTDYPTLTLKSARWNKNILLLGFEEVPDRNAAELLRNHHLYTEDELVEDDAWYEHQLIDVPVFHGTEQVGTVTALLTGPVQDLLEITGEDGREILVPFVEEIVTSVDLEGNRIEIDPPAGLLDIN